jgi:hypothetical protein
VEANSTGGQGSRRAVDPSDDDDTLIHINIKIIKQQSKCINMNNSVAQIIQQRPFNMRILADRACACKGVTFCMHICTHIYVRM